MGRRTLAGSLIGGIAETQEMLDFCGEHGITADVEVIPIQKINEAYERLLRSDVKYRFCIDMASLKSAVAEVPRRNQGDARCRSAHSARSGPRGLGPRLRLHGTELRLRPGQAEEGR